jgi:hypothetical protein
MNWDTAPQELDALRAQVAALTEERDHWQQAYERCNEVCKATAECWNADLAVAQVENVQLRDFVETVRELATIETPTAVIQALNSLDLHTYHTAALDALLAQEREACAVECAKYASNTSHQDVAAAIREMK